MKKVLFSLMAVAMAIGLVGSAFAYFTDVEKSTGNVMGAGTLDIQIADSNQGYGDTAVTASFNSPDDLAPGQTFNTGIVYIRNVGTIDIPWIFARFCDLHETVQDISKQIILKTAWESTDGGLTFTPDTFDTNRADVFLNYWIGRGANTAGMTADGSISLWDLVTARNFGSGDKITSLLLLNQGTEEDPALPSGTTAAFYFTFEFPSTTTNTFQGASATFEVDFIGAQYMDGYPTELLADYVTETIGD